MCKEAYPIENLRIKVLDDNISDLMAKVEVDTEGNYRIFKGSDLHGKLNKNSYVQVDVHKTGDGILFYAERESCAYRKSEAGFIAGRQGCIPYLVMNQESNAPLTIKTGDENYFPAYVAYHPKGAVLEYRCGYLRADLNVEEQAEFDRFYKDNDPYNVYFGFDTSEIRNDLYINKYQLFDCQ